MKSVEWRASQNVAQLNIHLDAATKEQFARVCKLRKISQREVIERFVIAWITGDIQLP